MAKTPGINAVLSNLGTTTRDLIEWVIGKTFLIDVGIVVSVSADKTHVDVNHLVLPTVNGVQLQAALTKGVELLFPGGGAELSMRWDVSAGDLVLLLALKDYVDPIAGKTTPVTPVAGTHYSQDTMKALPLSPYSGSSTHTIEASGGTLTIDGGTKGAARQDDATVANATTDAAFFTFLAAVATFMGAPGTAPTSLAGKVNAGSTKVKVG